MRRDSARPYRIGLTGGIASGKSVVAGMFADLGIPIIDTDLIAREIVEPGQPALEEQCHASHEDDTESLQYTPDDPEPLAYGIGPYEAAESHLG